MSLNMIRPYRHPKTGIYWLRKVVPAALIPLVGKTELKQSLRTKDPNEAKRLAPSVLSQFDMTLDQARLGLRSTADDLEALAGAYFQQTSDQFLEQARREGWEDTLFAGVDASHEAVLDTPPPIPVANEPGTADQNNPAEEANAIGAMLPEVNKLQQRHGYALRPEMQRHLALLLYKAKGQAIEAAQWQYQCAPGYTPPSYPKLRPLVVRSLPHLFQAYADDAQLRSSTRKDWGALIDHFHAFVERKAPDRITKQDIRRYAEHLREKGGLNGKPLSGNRLNQGYLASIRAMFGWAVKQDLLPANPAMSIIVKVRSLKPPIRGFTNEEVVAVLQATRSQSVPFKRWVPWLCAFTGARVSEILNLHRQHVGQTEGIWYLQIRQSSRETEDGAVQHTHLKNDGSTRCVPVHPALVAEGFLDYLESVPNSEYVFPGKWSDQHGNRTKGPANQLRLFIHSVVDITDELSPNHSFRHWLASQARRNKMDGDVRRQITGHKYTDVHGRYGPADIPFLAEALGEIVSPIPPPTDQT